MKFHENILNGFQLESGHDFVTDRLTDGHGKTMYLYPKAGGGEGVHNKNPHKVMCYASYQE